jgi:hypothetical protein
MAVPFRFPSQKTLVTTSFGLVLASVFAVSALYSRSGRADAETEARYPFDPACPWGRVANGQGMLKRCVSEAEAKRIIEGLDKAKATCGGAPTESAVAGTPVPRSAESAPSPSSEPTSAKGPRPFAIKLASIVAEEGEITMGKLAKPMDRYRQCVEQNGGLAAAKASVQLSFLVRGEFGKAEGVELKRVSGVSQEVGKCLADVVDRRATGTPTSAMTGVTLTFEITEIK